MNKPFAILLLCLFSLVVKAQTPVSEAQTYGKIDTADLKMTSCDFEKDANAEVLFDKEKCYFSDKSRRNVITERHIRIKIFNEHALDQANISIRYLTANFEKVSHIEAETFNLINGKVEITMLDNALIYTRKIDKDESEMVFSMPATKVGSVIEYKYAQDSGMEPTFPNWYIQNTIPMRYSEIISAIPYAPPIKLMANYRPPDILYLLQKINTTLFKSSITNSPSLPNEPYMRSEADVLADVTYTPTFHHYWIPISLHKLPKVLLDADGFGDQLDKEIKGSDTITNKAFAIYNEKERLSFVFNYLKNTMTWNGMDSWYVNNDLAKAWKSKTGNSAEINLVLYNLLAKSGIKAYPLLVSTRANGKISNSGSIMQFNRTVVLVPIGADSTRFYVLDATNKYNTSHDTPFELLNSVGLCLDVFNEKDRMVAIKNVQPVKKMVLIIAEVMPDGRLNGSSKIVDYGYNKSTSAETYKTQGEKKFIDYLKGNDNNIQISSLKFENFDVDTLPLTQTFNFNISLSASDQNYIYFNPCLFNPLNKNSFLSDKRLTDIDFGYQNDFEIRGTFKIPAGYKVDALPRSLNLTMPDKSITFKRALAEEEGVIAVRYTIDYTRSLFTKEEYPAIHEFYKKMHEMLNEQIVLKKL